MFGFSAGRRRETALRLAELLVAMTVIGVLVGFVLPHYAMHSGEYGICLFLAASFFAMFLGIAITDLSLDKKCERAKRVRSQDEPQE